MSNEWFYLEGDVQTGPISAQQLRALAQRGQLTPANLVWRHGLPDWIPAGKVHGLFTPPPATGARETPPSRQMPPSPMQSARFEKTPLRDQAQNQPNWKEIIAHRRNHVVLIEHSEGLGTGVLITSDGLIITNKHVVEGATSLQVSFANSTTTKGLVVHQHDTMDLAIIRAAVHNAGHFDIATDIQNEIDAGEDVLAIGHPHGHKFTSTRGIVSVPRQRFGKEYFLQHDVAINPGNSGGPLIDRFGSLVGINTFLRKDSRGLGFAIPADTVRGYVFRILTEIRSGATTRPSDDEILEAEEAVSPDTALRSAVMSFDGEHRELKDGGYAITATGGHTALAFIVEETFVCCGHLADLHDGMLADAPLFHWLLRQSDSLVQAKLTIDKDNEIWVSAKRFTAGLDATEAFSLIASVFHAIETLGPAVHNHLHQAYPEYFDLNYGE